MKKCCFFVMATMVAVFTACNNEFMNMGQEENLTPNATLKNNSSGEAEEEPLNYTFFDYPPSREFFLHLGEVHNACLDNLLEPLANLPMARNIETDTEVFALELDLLDDFVFHHVVDYLNEEYSLTQSDLAACGTYQNFYVDEHYDYLSNPMVAPTIDLQEYWGITREILYSEDMEAEQMAEELGILLESAYDALMAEGMTADEFTFMAYLGITRSSILYWDNDDNMMAYNDVYRLPGDFEITQAKRGRFWRADGRGAIAGGIGAAASGCWFLVPLVAIISLVVEAINDAITQNLQSWQEINACQPVNLSNQVMVYKECMEDFRTKYNLFDATKDPQNPYLTGKYWDIVLPYEELWYY